MHKKSKNKLSAKEVRHIAKLARIKISEEEEERYRGQLASILDYVNNLNEVDTNNIKPTSHAVGLTNVMRADNPSIFKRGSELIEAAPENDGSCVKVKAVLKGGKQ